MKQIPIKVDNVGDTFNAEEINSTTFEEQNIVTDTGQSLSGADLHQVSKAAAVYAGAGDFYTDTGTASAYQLATPDSKEHPPVYVEGQRVRFIPANSNSGTPPVTARIDTLPATNIKKNGGVDDLEAADIVIGLETILSYRTAAGGYWELAGVVEEATESRRGIIEIATAAEVKAGTDTEKAVVPAYLAEHPGVPKKWIIWTETGSGVTIQENVGFDATPITIVGSGHLRLNFTSAAMNSQWYRILGFCGTDDQFHLPIGEGIFMGIYGGTAPTTTTIDLRFVDSYHSTTRSSATYNCVQIFGELA